MTNRSEGEVIVSVVMPVYNASAYLEEALVSILTQTLSALECIVVDDGSTDGSVHIARRYAAADPRVHLLVHGRNRGNYPSRNEGMARARGEFIAVMDADDVALSERLERQVAFLRRRPECVMVGSQVLLVDPDGAPIGPGTPGHTFVAPPADLPLTHEAIDAVLMKGRWAVVHPTVTMRRRAVEAAGGYREQFRTCADHDLYLRLAERGRIANLPETLLHYRQRLDSLTRLQSDQMHNLRVIRREARRRRGLPVEPDGPIPAPERAAPLSSHERMQLYFHWAVIAMRHGYPRSALKNMRRSFTSDPAGALAWTVRRTGRRLHRLMRASG